MSASIPPRSPTAQRWARLVAAQERSDLSLRAFAARHDVNASTLAWWRSRLRHGHVGAGFVELRLPGPSAPSAPPTPPVRVVVRGSVSIEVPVGTDLPWLRRVVEALS